MANILSLTCRIIPSDQTAHAKGKLGAMMLAWGFRGMVR
jgi:hypothetical protein